MTPTAGEARIATVPWEALAGLERALEQPLSEVLSGTAAERVLDRTLRAHRDWSADQRTVAAEALFGVGLWRRRLRARTAPEAPPLALLQMLVDDLGQRSNALKSLTNWRDRHSVPDWLATELEAEWGDRAEHAAAALNAPGPICLRVNALKTTSTHLAQSLLDEGVTTTPGHLSPHALIITSRRPNLYGLRASKDAWFEVQDEGSQWLGQLVEAKLGDQVLDLCAGAGGKSLQLAAHVAPTGRVHAFDIDRARLDRLRHRAERAQATIAIHTERPTGQFDRVLVDAPCSELGALRRGPDLRWRIDPSTFAAHAVTGRALCEEGLSRLKPGGRLVFATCTFRHAENEAVVDAVLAANPRVRRLVADQKVAPHTHGTDGFYAAVLTCDEAGSSHGPGP